VDEWSLVRVCQKWYPQTLKCWIINWAKILIQTHGSHIMSMFNKMNITSSCYQKSINSSLENWDNTCSKVWGVNNIESWGFDFPQSTYIQKFPGLPSDKNNQGLTYIYYYLFIIFVSAVQCLTPLSFLIDPCNECWASDSQTRWF